MMSRGRHTHPSTSDMCSNRATGIRDGEEGREEVRSGVNERNDERDLPFNASLIDLHPCLTTVAPLKASWTFCDRLRILLVRVERKLGREGGEVDVTGEEGGDMSCCFRRRKVDLEEGEVYKGMLVKCSREKEEKSDVWRKRNSPE